jgi:hypothetical protein
MADFITALQGLHVDERAWPEPKAPPANPGNSFVPTRDGDAAPTPSAARPGESDTLVRQPVQTAQEKRLEPTTEPDRAPVARRTGPVKSAPPAAPLPQGKPPNPYLELPTVPERPMVSRDKATVPSATVKDPARQKIVGVNVPAAPPKPSPVRWLLWGTLIGLAGLAAAALGWWFTRR